MMHSTEGRPHLQLSPAKDCPCPSYRLWNRRHRVHRWKQALSNASANGLAVELWVGVELA